MVPLALVRELTGALLEFPLIHMRALAITKEVGWRCIGAQDDVIPLGPGEAWCFTSLRATTTKSTDTSEDYLLTD